VKRLQIVKDNQEMGLEAAIFLRKRNSSMIEFICIENLKRLSYYPNL